jgi:hypothetical protein
MTWIFLCRYMYIMYKYTYTIDGIPHRIKSVNQIHTADANGIIPISPSQNEVCRKLKFILREWIQLANENNIHWFCNGGTMLGAIRDKGLIHYDNDMDLVILFRDYPKIKRMVSDTCVIDVCEQGFQMHLKNQPYPFIDLWLEAPNPENPNEIILACPYFNGKCTYGGNLVWPNEKYAMHDVMNLVQLPFEDMMVNVPQNYECYIKQQYGDDCLYRYVVQDHTDNHSLYDIIPPPKIRMELWESWQRLIQAVGLDTCPTIAGQESYIIASLCTIEVATPTKSKMKRKKDVITRYIREKLSNI